MSIDDYAKNLLKNIANLRHEHHDVVLVAGVDKQRIPAHRIILMAASKYFEARLGPNFIEGTKNEIPLDEIDGSTLSNVLDFIYTGKIEITVDNVDDIISTASHMQLIALEEKCAKYCEANLSIENCVAIFLIADKYQISDLRSEAMNIICDHFEAVPIDDLKQIDETNFFGVLDNNQITATETIVFDRLTKWIDQNKVEASVVYDMIKLIRLNHIPNEFLVGIIQPFFDKYNCGKIVMDECCKRLLKTPEAIFLHRHVPGEIYCAFLDVSQAKLDIKKYDFTENNWSTLRGITLRRWSIGNVFAHGELFVMGGYIQSQREVFNWVASYKIDDLTETVLPPMSIKRFDFVPICIGKYIYVFGGRNGREHNGNGIDSCERFDIETRLWVACRAMPVALFGYTAVEFDGKIYVAGGSGHFPNGFYCYDPAHDLWSVKANLGLDVPQPRLIKTTQHLYAIGGRGNVNKYDAHRDVWISLGNFGDFGCIKATLSHNNQIYILCEDEEFKVMKIGNRCTLVRLPGLNLRGLGYLFL